MVASMSAAAASLVDRIQARQSTIGVIGLGYVGIPLAIAATKAGYKVLGFDIDTVRVDQLNAGKIAIRHIAAEPLVEAAAAKSFEATTDFSRLVEPDALLIAVPTPLTKNREPDLAYVVATAESIAKTLRPGQIIILESTTWPGTTNEVLRPILERKGLKSGQDFYLAFSPEREDPGNQDYGTSTIPKVVGGEGADALAVAKAVYDNIVTRTVPVSSAAAAEAVKLTENIFRSVNIALVNELKTIYSAMGIDVWEVIEAAKTKPFGFMPFYPGPGLGGHCIPIDPFYLTWKAREFGITTRFIELAGQINTAMPRYVVDQLQMALDRSQQRGLNGSRILVIGIAYKKNIDDMRESPSLELIELLERRGAHIDFYDPLIPVIPKTREHAALAGRRSVELTPDVIKSYHGVLVSTDHDAIDYKLLADHAALVVDTRNVFSKNGLRDDKIVKS